MRVVTSKRALGLKAGRKDGAIDVDGTVLSTGLQAERAFRGYNPPRRKVPSYYRPITAYLAQTGHLLACATDPATSTTGRRR